MDRLTDLEQGKVYFKRCATFITTYPTFPSLYPRRWKICLSQRSKVRLRQFSMKDQNPLSAREIKNQSHKLFKKYVNERETARELEAQHWVNLTNGVEMLSMLAKQVAGRDIRFTRLQSSHCEAAAYDKLLWSVDNDMLFSLAIGRPCYVYDLASRNKISGVPRALFLGLQFVRWSLAYLWFANDRPDLVPSCVMVRGKNTVPFWRDEVLPFRIGKDTKKRLRYFIPFVREMGVSDVRLFGIYGAASEFDGCMGLHVKFVRQWLETLSENDGDVRDGVSSNSCSMYDSNSTPDELRQIQKRIRSERDRIAQTTADD